MSIRSLNAVVAVLGFGEVITALINWLERTPDSEPALMLVFALPWLGAFLLLRGAHVVAGATASGVLCGFICVSFVSWRHYTVLDRVWQIGYAAVAVGGLALSVGLLLQRSRARSVQAS